MFEINTLTIFLRFLVDFADQVISSRVLSKLFPKATRSNLRNNLERITFDTSRYEFYFC